MRKEEQAFLISNIPHYFNETVKRIICGTMAVLMVAATALPVKQVRASTYETVDTTDTTADTEPVEYATTEDADFDVSQVDILGEVDDLRTLDTKTFMREDGTFVTAIYGEPVHYLSDGKYLDIDNTLSLDPETNVYSTKANAFGVRFPESLDSGKPIQLTYGDYSIGWILTGVSKASAAQVADTKVSDDPKVLTKVDQSVTYSSVMDGVDVEYVVTGSSVKENIVLNRFVEDFSLSFTYSLGNLSLVLQDDGTYSFTDENGKAVFDFASLYMFDAEGKDSQNIKMTVTEGEKGQYLVTIVPDSAWLKTAVYPVTIDPTISSATTSFSITDTHVHENDTTNYSGYSYLIFGNSDTNRYKGLINFTLPTVLQGKVITYAHLKFTRVNLSTGRTLGIYENTSSFTASSVTWATAPTYETAMTDYHITTGASGLYQFDITHPVKEWVAEGVTAVPGFTIKDKNEYGAYINAYSTEYSTVGCRPTLEIGYIDPQGIKDYWTYSSQDAGYAGTGYVSDLTGLLTWTRNDISFDTEKQAFAFSMIYNLSQRMTNIGYGAGWQTSYNMVAGYDSSVLGYYMIDETGSKVYYPVFSGTVEPTPAAIFGYFLPTGSTATYMKAEDGSGRMMMKVTNSSGTVTGYYVLTTDLTLLVFGTGATSTWYLSQISDMTCQVPMNTVVITRNSSYPAKITQIVDASGNKITLSYSASGNISSASLFVKNASGGYSTSPLQKITYYVPYYSSLGTYLLSYCYRQTNYVSDTTLSSAEYSFYTYDSSGGRMLTAYESSSSGGLGVTYTYDTTANRVLTTKTWYYSSSNAFSLNSYVYGDKRTTITDQDGHFAVLKFDDYGHTVCILDDEGNSQSFVYLNLFKSVNANGAIYTYLDGTPNYDNNHKKVLESGVEATDVNPLVNPGFEFDVTGTYDGWDYEQDPLFTSLAVRTTSPVKIGSYSMRLRNFDGGWVHLSQEMVLDAGTYTLSGYVYNATISDGNPPDVYLNIVGASYSNGIQRVDTGSVWTFTEMYFVVENDNTNITAQLVNADVGSAYFDGIQIKKGFTSDRQNALENSSFEYVYGGFMPGWTRSNSTYVTRAQNTYVGEDFSEVLGTYGVQIVGSGAEIRYAKADIAKFLDLSSLPGVLTVGGWGKSDAAATSISPGDSQYKYFRIRVELLDASNTILQTNYVVFDASISGWQFAYGEVTVPNTCAKINLYLEFQGEGTVTFDGITAMFEPIYTHYYVDQFGRIYKVVSQDGKVTEYSFADNYTRIPSEVALNGEVTTETTVEDGRITSLAYANVKETPTYNQYGQVTQLQVGEGLYFTTSTTYVTTNYSQYATSTTDEYGYSTYYTNDLLTGLLQAVQNAKDEFSSFAYDDEGKLIEVESGSDLGEVSEEVAAHAAYQYDAKDRLVKICLEYTDPASPTFYYQINYDTLNRISSVLVNSSNLMSYTYVVDDGYQTNQISTQVYANLDHLEFSYDELDRVSQIDYHDSTNTSLVIYAYEYDPTGNLSVYSETRSGVLTAREFYAYDSSGRLSKAVDESGNTTSYGYDEKGNVCSLAFSINGIESETTYDFDPYSLISQTGYTTVNGFSMTRNYTYEANALKRLTNILLTDGIQNGLKIKQSFTYSGALSQIMDLSYDFSDDGTIDYKYSFIYDESGNIVQESYYELVSAVLTLTRKTYYEYDSLNQLVAEDVWQSSGSSYTNVYEYDSRGNRVANYRYAYEYRTDGVTIPSSSTPINLGTLEVTPYYNGNNLYSTIYFTGLQKWHPSFTFTFKTEGGDSFSIVPTRVGTDFDGLRKGYYVTQYRAQAEILGETIDCTFTMRISVGALNPNPGTSTNYSTYIYDDAWLDQLDYYDTIVNGTSTRHEISYDAQGNPTEITNVVYRDLQGYEQSCLLASLEWQGRQLTSIKFNSDESTILATVSYQYNDQGYRISKQIIEGSTTKNISYTLAGDKVVYETNGSYGILFTYDYDGTLISFNYDPNVNDSTAGTDYFYLRNQQGDITMITDASGHVVMKYSFDAYGNMTCSPTEGYTNLTLINPYTYRGYRFDSDIGMYYLNSRYYNPQIGRFLNGDGMLGKAGDILSTNMYAYCANNPVMCTDRTGKFVSTIIGAVTGALAGALTALVTGGDFWANVGYGALTGALAGLVVDVSVATGGVGGLIIAGAGGFIVGGVGDVIGQMWLEGKSWDEVDKGRAATVGAISAVLNMASFGIGRALLSGSKLTGNIFQKVTQSFLQSGYGDWIAQSVFALAFCSLPTIPTWISSDNDEVPANAIVIDQYDSVR